MSHLDDTFYYDTSNNSVQILRYLDCYERVIYFYYKNKCKLNYDVLNLLISNYLPLIEIENNKVIDILGYPSDKINHCTVELSYVSDNLSDMLKLLKRGEYVVFQTSDADLPFSTIYKKYNLDESEYGDYYLAIDYIDEYLYFPLIKYNDCERLHQYNKNISYIHCNDLKEAFDKQLKIYLFFCKDNKEQSIDFIHHELLKDILRYYNLSKKESNHEIKYGIACIESLLNYSTSEVLHLNDYVGTKILYLKLRSSFLKTIGKRQVWKECLGNTDSLKYEDLIQKISNTINAYIKFISILEIEYMKKNMIFGSRYTKSLEEILNCEQEMNQAIFNYIKREGRDMKNDIINDIIEFIKDEIINNQEVTITIDDNIITKGYIDSLGMVKLIGYLNERYNIDNSESIILDNFLVLDNFRTVDNISDLVMKYIEK